MTAQQIHDEIEIFGRNHSNAERVAKYKRYFREGYDAWGMEHCDMDEAVSMIMVRPGFNYDLMLETTLSLVTSQMYEMTVLAIRLMREFYKKWDKEAFNTVEKWFSLGISNWAHTDYICGELIPLFFKKGLADMPRLEPWRNSGHKFQRRASLVGLIKPMKKETDFMPLLKFIEPLMHDPAREVHQGAGWLLREMWKKQPEPVEAFLLRFRETAPRLIFQYATEKMTPAGKEMFRRKRL